MASTMAEACSHPAKRSNPAPTRRVLLLHRGGPRSGGANWRRSSVSLDPSTNPIWLVSAQPDTHRDRNELRVLAVLHDVVEPPFDEQTGATGLEVEAGAHIQAEIGGTAGNHVIGIIRPRDLGVVDSSTADEIRAERALFGRFELQHQISGP